MFDLFIGKLKASCTKLEYFSVPVTINLSCLIYDDVTVHITIKTSSIRRQMKHTLDTGGEQHQDEEEVRGLKKEGGRIIDHRAMLRLHRWVLL